MEKNIINKNVFMCITESLCSALLCTAEIGKTLYKSTLLQ